TLRIVRPLLERTRAECAEYVRLHGIVARADSTNEEDRFFRNRVRRHALPALGRHLGVDVAARLARLADDLAVEARLADERIEELLGDAASELGVGVVQRAGEAARRLVHAGLVRNGVRASHAQIASVVAIAQGRSPSACVDLAGGRTVARCYERLALGDREADLSPALP